MRLTEQQASGSTAQVLERLQYLQGAACEPGSKAGEPAQRTPQQGMHWGISVSVRFKPLAELSGALSCGDAEARLLPHEYAELEKGAQVNATQHLDACSARSVSPNS